MNVTELIKSNEGLRLKPYHCTAGKLTIGYGRNLDDKGISEAEAESMLWADIAECRRWISETLPWSRHLDTVRLAALTDLRYNLGGPRLLTFKKFMAAMEAGNYAAAGAELVDSLWYTQVRDRGPRIVKLIQLGAWE